MDNNNFIDTWEKHKHVPEKLKLDKEMISNYLKPKVSKVTWTFNFNLVFFISAFVGSVILLSMNLYIYKSNPVMLAIESGLLLACIVFICYGIYIFMKIREINNFSKDLRELLNTKIKFLRFHYEIWLLITAFEVWILSFALNTLVDNQEGFYRINRVGFFIIVSLAMVIFIYVTQKISAEISLRNLKAILSDLENNYLSDSETFEQKKKKMRYIYLILSVISTGLLILGILRLLRIV